MTTNFVLTPAQLRALVIDAVAAGNVGVGSFYVWQQKLLDEVDALRAEAARLNRLVADQAEANAVLVRERNGAREAVKIVDDNLKEARARGDALEAGLSLIVEEWSRHVSGAVDETTCDCSRCISLQLLGRAKPPRTLDDVAREHAQKEPRP